MLLQSSHEAVTLHDLSLKNQGTVATENLQKKEGGQDLKWNENSWKVVPILAINKQEEWNSM